MFLVLGGYGGQLGILPVIQTPKTVGDVSVENVTVCSMKTGGKDGIVTPGGEITLHQEAVVLGSNVLRKVR